MVGQGSIEPKVHPSEGARDPPPSPNQGPRLRLAQHGAEIDWTIHDVSLLGIPRGPPGLALSQEIPRLVAVMQARQATIHQDARDLEVVRQAEVRWLPVAVVTNRGLRPWPCIPLAPLVRLGLVGLFESRRVLAVWQPPCRGVVAAVTSAVVAVDVVAAPVVVAAVFAAVVVDVVAAGGAAAAVGGVVEASAAGDDGDRAAAVVAGSAAAPER